MESSSLTRKAQGCEGVRVTRAAELVPALKAALAGIERKKREQEQIDAWAAELAALPTIAVGLITEPQQAEDILVRGDADLIAMARAFLYKPRWVWEAAAALHGKVEASPQYWRCMPREAQGIFDAVRIGQR